MKKKTIKIAHLYYDLMNLYGESGNVRALKKFIERQDINAEVYSITVGDNIDFTKYDFYYIGAGTFENFKIVLNDLQNYKTKIKNAIEKNKMFLLTGNAMELFGKKIRLESGKSLECLGIFNYQSYTVPERILGNAFYKFDKLPKNRGNQMIGFLNRNTEMVYTENRMFGFADNTNYKNFFAMNMIGPVLIRSPYFTNYLIERLFEDKGLEYKEIDDTVEFDAYHEFIRINIKEKNLD